MLPEFAGVCPLIQVFDTIEASKFYCEELGFEIEMQSPIEDRPYPHFNWALLKRGDVQLMLNTAYEADERPAFRDPARVSAHKDTILYFGCDDIDGAYAHLRARGLDVGEPRVSHGMKEFYFSDPDGYGICFNWPARG